MTLSAGTEQLLQWLIIIAGVLLIPVGLGIIVVLFKLAFLIHSASDFLAFATYELSPVIKEIRKTVDHIGTIGERASVGAYEVSQGIKNTGPLVKSGLSKLKVGTWALVSGIGRSFGQS
jgi:hypothetical protein